MKKCAALLMVTLLWACDYHLKSEPPLHQAAYRGDVEQINALIKAGDLVNSVNGEGATPLHWAAFKGNLEAAKLLVRYGADVNALTKKGSTPMRLAKTHKQKKVEDFLRSRGGIIPGEDDDDF